MKLLLGDPIAALSTGLVYTLGAYSFACLIFSGPLAPYLSYGFNLILISNIIGCLFTARFSSYPIVASLTQPSTLTIFSLISTALVANNTHLHPYIDPIYTIYAAMILLTMSVGLVLWVLGKFRAGNLVRFIPFPVIAAFLAASGWILILFSIQLLTQGHWGLFHSTQCALSVGIVISIFLLQRQFSRAFIEPIVYIATIVLFYFVLLISKTSFSTLKVSGWYLDIVTSRSFSNPLHLLDFDKIQWSAFLDWGIAGNILAIIAIAPIFLLFSINGIEKETQHEFDYNDELKYTGISNIVLSLFGGGAVVSAGLTGTLRNYQLGAKSFLVSFYMALLLALSLIFGAFILETIPLFIVASLPLMTGITLLRTWLIETYQKLSLSDYLFLWFIFLVIVINGFLTGILLGIVAALMLFDYRYSRINIIRNTFTGEQLHSNNERGLAAGSLLGSVRSGIEVTLLQGYLFFGNMNALVEGLISKIKLQNGEPLFFIILDFRNTQGMDPASAESFFRLYKHTKEEEVQLVFTNISHRLFQNILGFLKLPPENNFCLRFDTLDAGLEWCENELLKQKTINWNTYFSGQLHALFPSETEFAAFSSYLSLIEIPEGAFLFLENDVLLELFFLETGVLELVHREPSSKETRVKTIYPGAFVGENSFYSGSKHALSCVARKPSSVYSLSFNDLIRLETAHPKLAITLHRYIAAQTLDRLSHAQKIIFSLI